MAHCSGQMSCLNDLYVVGVCLERISTVSSSCSLAHYAGLLNDPADTERAA
jgi:hypothetical protein